MRVHVPGHRGDEGVEQTQDAVLTKFARREDQLKDPQENQAQQRISPNRMHHEPVDLLPPVPARMSDTGDTLKEVQTCGMPRGRNCRIRRLTQKACNFVLGLGNRRCHQGGRELRQRVGITLYKLQGLETSRRECRVGDGQGCRSGNGAGNSNVIPSVARNLALTCRGRTQSEIPRYARNDSFALLSRFEAGVSSIAAFTLRGKTSELLRQPRDGVFDFRRIDEGLGMNLRRLTGKSQGGAERVEDSLPAGGNRLYHRNAEVDGKGLGIDEDAFTRRLVHHVQADDHRRLQVLEFQSQFQASRQLGSVHDVDNHIPLATEKTLASDGLEGICGSQGIEAGQINQVNDHPIHPRLATGVLDGGSGKVGGEGAVACDSVK